MIHVDNLAKRFGHRVAIEQISFHVARGEVFGLLGPNGGGKTTTMRLIAGLLRPTTGTATVDGRALAEDGQARQTLGFLTEQPGLYDRLTAYENLAFYGRLFDLSESDVRTRTMDGLRRVALHERAHDKVGTFSKGMRQRLALARTLLHAPHAILLDEPTSGLDPEAAAEVREVIASEAARGAAVIVSTHNLAEAERICHRVAVVKNRLLSVVDDRDAATLRVTIRARSVSQAAIEALSRIEGVQRLIAEDGVFRVDATRQDAVSDAVAMLVSSGGRVDEVVRLQRPLEERYLEAVGATSTDSAGAAG
jgi:ABC-2 type transport system ATP-binding protein